MPRSPSAFATMRASPVRRCTARLSSSSRRAVSRSPWLSARLASHGLRLRAGARRAGAEREQLLQSLAALLHMVPQLPEAPERRADPQADLRLACIQRPSERGADVVSLGVEPLEPLALLWAEQTRLGLLGQDDVEGSVPSSDGLAVAARHQTLERKLADGLEHPQPRLVAGVRARS